jgi:hypothetical protein
VNPIETLRILAGGGHPDHGLLHTARLAAFGIEAHGEEQIVETFQSAPSELSDTALVVTAPGHAAIFDGATALIADLSGDNLSRLWRLGGGEPLPTEPRIATPFDSDLTQGRGAISLVPSDHPSLAADAITRVQKAVQALMRDDQGFSRTRPFVIRAFGTAEQGAALIVAHRFSRGLERRSGFTNIALAWSPQGDHVITDIAGEAAWLRTPWTPRVPEEANPND